MENVTISDVTLREYGQNIQAGWLHIFTPATRIDITLKLIEAGFKNIEILSCVHPGLAPAMHESLLKEVVTGLGRIHGVNLITLVPNREGYKNFLCLNLGPDGFNHTMGLFFSAVEVHNLANLGRPSEDTIAEYKQIAKDAFSRNIRMVACISAAFGYFDTGKNIFIRADLDKVNYYIDLLLDLGVQSATLSDLQGVANEKETKTILETILNKRKGRDIHKLGYHPHHESGEAAVANSKVSYDLGIRRFDSSIGGTGGCVTGAPGNQPTEKLIHFFQKSGIETGLDEKKILSLADVVRKELYTKIGF